MSQAGCWQRQGKAGTGWGDRQVGSRSGRRQRLAASFAAHPFCSWMSWLPGFELAFSIPSPQPRVSLLAGILL